MSVLARWRGRLAIRKGLLATARAKYNYWVRRHKQSVEWNLSRPERARRWKNVEEALELVKKRKSQVAYAQRVVARHSRSTAWGGSRAVANEVIGIVNGRAPVTSRKRSWGARDSDHNVINRNADAVDFGIANAHWLKNEISRKLGGPREVSDYQTFTITRNGRRYRIQMIAGTHGTGPHLHVGIRRA